MLPQPRARDWPAHRAVAHAGGMCGRYRLTRAQQIVADEFEEIQDLHIDIRDIMTWRPRYNIAPMQVAPVLLVDGGQTVLRAHRWGLVPGWAKEAKIGAQAINARCETVAEKPMFRAAFKKRRAVVPASGFYEWQLTADGKVPHSIQARSGHTLYFAGLREEWVDRSDPDLTSLVTFTVVTCPPNATMQGIHDRMPVILPPEQVRAWLDPGTSPTVLAAMMAPANDALLDAYPVSPAVGSVRNDSPALIERVEPQRRLFG